jgi:diacylglycerol kinase family enzyme
MMGAMTADWLNRGQLAVFVVNGARAGRLDGLRGRIAEAARASGWADPLVLTTTRADGGTGMTRQALQAGADLVVAVGGDGTVRACAQELASTDVPLAIVPAGSANLTARALGLPRSLGAALACAFRGADRRIDLAGIEGMICTAMAGIGMDAAVVGATSDRLKRRAGWPAYAAASAGQLLDEPVEFTIRLDGGPPAVRRARSVVVGNSGLLPGGFPILPDARLDDGLLDVGILAPAGLAGWASIGYRAVVGSRRDDFQLERYRARLVEIKAARQLPRQLDGEVMPASDTLSVAVLPGALRVRVSQPGQRRSGSRPG